MYYPLDFPHPYIKKWLPLLSTPIAFFLTFAYKFWHVLRFIILTCIHSFPSWIFNFSVVRFVIIALLSFLLIIDAQQLSLKETHTT